MKHFQTPSEPRTGIDKPARSSEDEGPGSGVGSGQVGMAVHDLGRPSLGSTLKAFPLAGIAALLAWEGFARGLVPLYLGGPLEPTGLIRSLSGKQLGIDPGLEAALALHVATAIIFYPIGYWIMRSVTGRLGDLANGVLVGIGTWLLAMGVFAVLAGFPFLFNFGKIAWASLLGHVVYGLVLALLGGWLERLFEAKRQEA